MTVTVKDIVVEKSSEYDTLICEDGLQIVILKGQQNMVGRKVTINNGVLTEAAPEIKRKPITK